MKNAEKKPPIGCVSTRGSCHPERGASALIDSWAVAVGRHGVPQARVSEVLGFTPLLALAEPARGQPGG